MTNATVKKGFTILELVIVLGVFALFAGSAATFMFKGNNDRANTFYAELQNFARDTKSFTLSERNSHYLHFDKDKIWRSNKEEPVFKDSYDHLPVPEGTLIFLSNDKEQWTKISAKKTFTWLFSRSGICESLTLRFTLEGSDFECTFVELTAAIKQS